eukprot:1158008-Pelagomonas_calceolata.AAC.8
MTCLWGKIAQQITSIAGGATTLWQLHPHLPMHEPQQKQNPGLTCKGQGRQRRGRQASEGARVKGTGKQGG